MCWFFSPSIPFPTRKKLRRWTWFSRNYAARVSTEENRRDRFFSPTEDSPLHAVSEVWWSKRDEREKCILVRRSCSSARHLFLEKRVSFSHLTLWKKLGNHFQTSEWSRQVSISAQWASSTWNRVRHKWHLRSQAAIGSVKKSLSTSEHVEIEICKTRQIVLLGCVWYGKSTDEISLAAIFTLFAMSGAAQSLFQNVQNRRYRS